MDGKSAIERLFGWARPRREAKAIDAADVGTAYGMELSIADADESNDDDTSADGEQGGPAAAPSKPR